MMRFIGVDLHTTQITVCYLNTEQEERVQIYRLEEIGKFVAQLQSADELAVARDRQHQMVCRASQSGGQARSDCQSASISSDSEIGGRKPTKTMPLR